MIPAPPSPTPVTDAVVPFGDRLQRAFDAHGQLCVGIDPHSWLLSDWDLPDSAAGVEAFGRTVVEAAAGRVGIIKPQVAFFERFGSAGFAALERILADARAAGLLVIADVKRGDLGTSVEAYAQAWLAVGSPLEVDAITVSAYMGVGSLDAAIDVAAEGGKGMFVLSATSNPEAALIQRAIVADGPRAGRSVARAILDEVAERNITATTGPLGSIGVVLGATLDLAGFGIDVAAAPLVALTPVLAPGFGHQGADVTNINALYGGYAQGVIVSESRSVLGAGPDRLVEAIVRRVAETGAARG
ncbi:orotidine-5'-phosphate decarboxylase [Cryobacterium sp. TMT1-2-1]|uniref:orotidine-5'-phosphate decarboxylase n=1 Tax=Cryobacterium sp. TMT1-2-1 TaxID=1259232 RepID=UPI001F544A50|nr:orotidine-5'-phosphate decarboxylase [Cryobacterium sp. TMT1-2-1]